MGRMRNWAVVGVVIGTAAHCQAETRTLKVTDFGARGDAVQLLVSTTSNSPVISVSGTSRFGSADVGKLVLLFGAGPYTTPTNNQDLVATITAVSGPRSVTLSLRAGASSNDVAGVMGTQNAGAFQHCVDASRGSKTVLSIPAGRYLLVPPEQLTTVTSSWQVPAAVVIRKGGIHFLGDGVDRSILLGCGAWKLHGNGTRAMRGFMFNLVGPVNNNAPLAFEGLTLDGGVQAGNTGYHGFPARLWDGAGWDETHDAVVDSGQMPLHALKTFVNCRFTRWRGEMVKSVCGCGDGMILFSNCTFDDGNASGFNFTFTHRIDHCVFSNLFQVSEFYQAYSKDPSYMQNCLITNITGNAIAINGALTNSINPPYNIISNKFYKSGGFAILTTPAQNLFIIGNDFVLTNSANGIGLGCAGYQGSAINSNIVVALNSFTGAYSAFGIMGSGQNSTAQALIYSNTAVGVHWFAAGYGWSTNISFWENTSDGTGLLSGQLKGQWYLDDASNRFPPWQVVGAAGKTNTVTYAAGMRQRTWAQFANTIFAIDDAHPQQIPPGAVLSITHAGEHPAPLYLSTTMSGSSVVLRPGHKIMCQWTNGGWQELPRR